MSSETEFKCNFCRESIVSTTSSNGAQGWCMVNKIWQDRKFVSDLFHQLRGPHICSNCVKAITEYTDYTK